jgi:hypothetical protein
LLTTNYLIAIITLLRITLHCPMVSFIEKCSRLQQWNCMLINSSWGGKRRVGLWAVESGLLD